MLEKATHQTDEKALRAYYRSLSPNERVALTVELSRRMRQLQVENGRAPEVVSAITQQRRR